MKTLRIIVFILIGLCFIVYYYTSIDDRLVNTARESLNNRTYPVLRETGSCTFLNNEGLTFERRAECNMGNQKACYSTNKSLVLTFWSDKTRRHWLSKNILSAFPSHSFDHLIFVFDNSTWITHPDYKHLIWIHVYDQHRLWYVKRFLPPAIIKTYKYVWCVDDDSKLNFVPLHYQCVIDHLHIPLSSPGRTHGVISLSITARNSNFTDRIGRWTDVVETGPTFVASSAAWLCIYEHLDPSTGSGWGFDLTWCNMLADACFAGSDRKRMCAILDVFGIDHQSETINSASYGAPEFPYYKEKYKRWLAQQQEYGPLAENNSLLEQCTH